MLILAWCQFLLHFSHFYCIFSIFIAPWNRHSMMQWWHKPEQCIYIKAQKIFHILTSSIAPNKTYLEILTYMYLYLLRYHNNFILTWAQKWNIVISTVFFAHKVRWEKSSEQKVFFSDRFSWVGLSELPIPRWGGLLRWLLYS